MTRRCLVDGCPYKHYRPQTERIHCFPHDDILRKLWHVKTGSPWNNIIDSKLKDYGICSHHFSDDAYKNDSQFTRRHLLSYALPNRNLPQANTQGVQFSHDTVFSLVGQLRENEIQLKKQSDTESTLKAATISLKVSEKSLTETKKELEKLKKNLSQLQEKHSTSGKLYSQSEIDKLLESKIFSAFSEVFTVKQIEKILFKQKRKKWTEIDMSRAIAIYNVSSACYVYLRENLNYPLPSDRTVKKWLSSINISPGLILPVFKVLKEEFKDFTPLQRLGVVCFDEVSIDSRVELEEKYQIILGPSKHLMGIYVRSLCYKWKQIIYFDFDLRLTKTIIFEILEELWKVGINVVAMVSDMSTINIRVWNELKIDIKNDKFSFIHPTAGNNVWMFADFCHMLKLLRNHFLDHPIKLGSDFGDAVISVSVIKDLLRVQTKDLRMTHKLSERHTNMNNRERMDVRTAFELFSASVANTILFLFPEFSEMANFFMLVNDFGDLLNSRKILSEEENFVFSKAPFGLHLQFQLDLLNKFQKNIGELRVQSSRPITKPFQKGFKLICGSLKGLFEDLRQAPINCSYILTSHLNQDFVESSFGGFRAMGGYNDLPMPTDAIRRIKGMVVSWNIRCPRTGNIHCENDTQFLSSNRLKLLMSEVIDNAPTEDDLLQLSDKLLHIKPEVPVVIVPLSQLTTEEIANLCGSEFLAGYIAKKFIKEHSELANNYSQNSVGWIRFISRGHLTNPSDFWFGMFLKFEQYFEEFHRPKYSFELKLNKGKNVIRNLSNYLVRIFPGVPDRAIHFYVRLRTIIRIKAVNKHIVNQRRKRRSQTFFDSIITSEETAGDGDEEVNYNAEVVTNYEFDGIERETLFDEDLERSIYQEINANPEEFDIFEEEDVIEAFMECV